ncbi:MAG: hypothetical protein ABFE07_29400 [Armatimonadia bacterium]
MQRRKGLTRRTPLRSGQSRLKTRKPLRSRSGLGRTRARLKRTSRLRPRGKLALAREFAPEVIAQMLQEQRGACLRCGRSSTVEHWLDPHHKKPRSALTAKDIREHGPGGGRKNCLGLCRDCHDAVHRHEPGTEKYRTQMNQEVGEDAVVKS